MTVKQNKARYFNSIMPGVNHKWAAKALNMQINPDAGPDLIDSNKIVEIKFAVTPNQRNYIKWTVLEHQLNYETKHPNKKAFWGLGTYHIKQPPSTIKTKDPKELESLVISRELFIVSQAIVFFEHPSSRFSWLCFGMTPGKFGDDILKSHCGEFEREFGGLVKLSIKSNGWLS